MTELAWVLVGLPLGLFVYAYLVYPAMLEVLTKLRPQWRVASVEPTVLPMISLTIPAYNEEASIQGAIESLLQLEYPRDRWQVLIISDASTDRTDEIVRGFAGQGVELLRMPVRGGKTGAENAAGALLRGEIVVNTDATTRIAPGALLELVQAFRDPTVGVASGRDVSVGAGFDGTRSESGYVGYEMWLRSLETQFDSIVGASGCFYAIRRKLHETLFPEALSRDFACALIAREHGYRAVSVDEAICLVPRTKSLRKELQRKVRTMARGLDTLWYKRHLMNPLRYGWFSWMLFSHKLCRWLVFLTVPTAILGLVILSPFSRLALALLLLVVGGGTLGVIGLRWPEGRRMPRLISLSGFLLAANLAGVLAWLKALRGERNPIWEPTRRPV